MRALLRDRNTRLYLAGQVTGAGLIAAVSYRVMLLIIAAIMTLAAGYLATRRDRPPQTRADMPQPASARDC